MGDPGCFPFTSLFRRLHIRRRRSPPLPQPGSASMPFANVSTSTITAEDLPQPKSANSVALMLAQMFCHTCRVYRQQYLGIQEGNCAHTMQDLSDIMRLYWYMSEYRGGVGIDCTTKINVMKRMHEAMREVLYFGEEDNLTNNQQNKDCTESLGTASLRHK
ncbi:hypothetical protein QJS10_CPB15g00506 [Acorus calamus]|uniref:Uncharacterized protein n=1 Tax=Acorus calamus TaxID=4465 RepID=A0AAV9D623_ACOCL|nr:hypothetical protein QJS10_CPB15g00506 [Acorus calamus]